MQRLLLGLLALVSLAWAPLAGAQDLGAAGLGHAHVTHSARSHAGPDSFRLASLTLTGAGSAGAGIVLPTADKLSVIGTSLVQFAGGLDPNGAPTNYATSFGSGHGAGALHLAIDNKLRAQIGGIYGVTSSTSLSAQTRASSALTSNAYSLAGGGACGTVVGRNPACDSTANGADRYWNVTSDGALSPLDAANGNVLFALIEANDGYVGSGYYSSTDATQSMVVIKQLLDDAHAAGKVVFLADGTPRGKSTWWLETCTVTAAACAAVNGGNGAFEDGESWTPYPVAGVIDSTGNTVLTKVASAPAAGQYTVDSTGHYAFNAGSPPTSPVYITYSANTAGLTATTTRHGDLHGWLASSASNYVGTSTATNFARPGALNGRTDAFSVATWAALSDGSSPGKLRAGCSADGIHLGHACEKFLDEAFATAFTAAYPAATSKARDVLYSTQNIGKSGVSTVHFASTSGGELGNPLAGSLITDLAANKGQLHISYGAGTVDITDVDPGNGTGQLTGAAVDSSHNAGGNFVNYTTGAWDLWLTATPGNAVYLYAYLGDKLQLVSNPFFETMPAGVLSSKSANISGTAIGSWTISTDASAGDVAISQATDPISGKNALKIVLSGVSGTNVALTPLNAPFALRLVSGDKAVARANITVQPGANGKLYGLYSADNSLTITIPSTARTASFTGVTTIGSKMDLGQINFPFTDMDLGSGPWQRKPYSPAVDLTGYAGGAVSDKINIVWQSGKPKSATVYVSGVGLWSGPSINCFPFIVLAVRRRRRAANDNALASQKRAA